MNSSFTNPSVVGVVTQSQPATQSNHLVRYGELYDIIASLVATIGVGYSGVIAPASAAANGTVTGLGLSFTPTKCYMTVRAPDGNSLALEAQPVGSLTADGFSWVFMNGVPDNGNYRISYLLLP
jgi:hypothetical protein